MTLLILSGSAQRAIAQNDIENVIVETYYISDANDATDTTGGLLVQGSRTYRVYIDLCETCALRAIYGDTAHPLIIESTAPFFNHLERGKTYGHEINNGAMDEGTAALDSWLAMSAATNQRYGLLKSDDPDGSAVGGTNNDGGSAMIPGGLLVNQDPDAGIPLTVQDGLVPVGGGVALPPNFNLIGDDPASVFLDSTLASIFQTPNTRIGCSTPGVQGPTVDNRILVAQLTTAGDLTFELNIEVQQTDGDVIKYVARDTLLQADETANGLLVYPPQCGCTDPNFLEYDPTAGCDDGSCQTAIIFGCLDPLACNYDPDANFNVSELCCYGPDSCNGLDITLICPDIGVTENGDVPDLHVFPNPVQDRLTLSGHPLAGMEVNTRLYDIAGRVLRELLLRPMGEGATMDLSGLAPGPYVLRVQIGRTALVRTVIKE